MKLGLVFDPHLSDKAPSTRLDNYRDAILEKIKYIVELGNNKGYAGLLIAGDVFHKKIPSHNSHELIKLLMDIFSKAKFKIYIIPGNHDFLGTVLNISRQPMAVLEKLDNVKIFYGEDAELITDSDLSVSISGKPFNASLDNKEASDLYNLPHIEADYKIGLFHQMLLPDGQTFFSEYINISDLENVNSDIIVNGHYHVGFNPSVLKQKGKYFINGGSLSRGSSEDFNLEKKPKFVELSLTKDNISYLDIVVPHQNSKEIFDTKMIERRKENKAMKEFINNLNEFEASSLTSESPEGIMKILDVMSVPEEIKRLADKYLIKAFERLS